MKKTTTDHPTLQQIHEATNQLWLTRKEPWGDNLFPQTNLSRLERHR
jgi:hypothetical protein